MTTHHERSRASCHVWSSGLVLSPPPLPPLTGTLRGCEIAVLFFLFPCIRLVMCSNGQIALRCGAANPPSDSFCLAHAARRPAHHTPIRFGAFCSPSEPDRQAAGHDPRPRPWRATASQTSLARTSGHRNVIEKESHERFFLRVLRVSFQFVFYFYYLFSFPAFPLVAPDTLPPCLLYTLHAHTGTDEAPDT